jgi:hypothetical protein
MMGRWFRSGGTLANQESQLTFVVGIVMVVFALALHTVLKY